MFSHEFLTFPNSLRNEIEKEFREKVVRAKCARPGVNQISSLAKRDSCNIPRLETTDLPVHITRGTGIFS